jgi:hypothetical protein
MVNPTIKRRARTPARPTQRWLRRVGRALRLAALRQWAARQLWRLLAAGRALGRAAGRAALMSARALYRHLLEPALCLACILGGAFLTMLLPVSLWAWVGVAGAALPALTEFPLASLPSQEAALRALVSAFALAVRVFATGGYQRWQATPAPLLARMLIACHEGLIWPRSWFRPRRRPAAQ